MDGAEQRNANHYYASVQQIINWMNKVIEITQY